ncbi:hypothetical protein FRC04_008849 [Tulasnella sp. 424]|nr:hypothetical protein FRC04_008849 [Tulasnella sp. 424]
MDRPVHLIIKLPYDRPANAPQEPIPVKWTPQKEQFLWGVLSDARKADGTLEVDWPGLSKHLGVPLPYLLYRTQLRFEEELRGLRDVGTSGLQLPGPSTQGATGLQLYPTDRLPKVESTQRVSNNNTPSNLSLPVAQTPSLRSAGTSAAPTPTRFATPVPPRIATGRPTGPSESTMTLTQRPSMVPLSARGRGTPMSPPRYSEDTEASSSSVEEPREDDEPEQQLGRRLQDLAKLMNSGMLGFATQPRTPVLAEQPAEQRPFFGRAPLAPTGDKGKGREIMPPSRSAYITPASTVNPSPVPRGRPVPASLISTATAKSQFTTSTSTATRTDSRSHSQQHSSSSSISETRSAVGSIPSITSLPQSRSPTRSSSAAASSASPVPSTGQSRSPSLASSPPRPPPVQQQAMLNRHLKKLSLDAASSSSASDAPPAAFGARMPLRQSTRTRTSERGGSAHGSSPSSFSDISDLSINSAMEEALMSNMKTTGISKLWVSLS